MEYNHLKPTYVLRSKNRWEEDWISGVNGEIVQQKFIDRNTNEEVWILVMEPEDVEVPEMLDTIDITRLKNECKNYIEFLFGPEYDSNMEQEYQNAIYEEAVIAVYGEDIFNKINKHLKWN